MSGFKIQRAEPNGLNAASSSMSPSAGLKSFRKVFDSINQLSRMHEFDEVTGVFSQIDQQKRYIEEQHTHLDEKRGAIDVLTAQYQDLKNESSKIRADKDSLQKIIAEKDNTLADKSEDIKVMQSQIGKLESQIKDYCKEFTKYQNIEKEKVILEQQRGLDREKIQNLQLDKLSLSAKIATTDTQLQNLKAFTAKQSTETENSVSVLPT